MTDQVGVTTIKVPMRLRDDLRAWASSHDEPSLASALDSLLERAREDEFWRGVDRAHLSRGDRNAPESGLAAARERLADSEDDRVSHEDAW
jgi:hypothetical protein